MENYGEKPARLGALMRDSFHYERILNPTVGGTSWRDTQGALNQDFMTPPFGCSELMKR